MRAPRASIELLSGNSLINEGSLAKFKFSKALLELRLLHDFYLQSAFLINKLELHKEKDKLFLRPVKFLSTVFVHLKIVVLAFLNR